MAQWIRLGVHVQWVMGLDPISRVIGGVRKGIRPQLLLCFVTKTVQRPAQKKVYAGFLKRYGDFKWTLVKYDYTTIFFIVLRGMCESMMQNFSDIISNLFELVNFTDNDQILMFL